MINDYDWFGGTIETNYVFAGMGDNDMFEVKNISDKKIGIAFNGGTVTVSNPGEVSKMFAGEINSVSVYYLGEKVEHISVRIS